MSEDIYCPKCKPLVNRLGRRLDRPLALIESNYSGCGEDIMACPECERVFSVSYKVDEVTHLTGWGGNDDVCEDKPSGELHVTASKFRKKPVVIEAVQWDGDADTANGFLGERYGVDWEYSPDGGIVIPTLEGKMSGRVGDWIIKGVKGEFYPCKDSIFQLTYEPVEPEETP